MDAGPVLAECEVISGLPALERALPELESALEGFQQAGAVAAVQHFLTMPSTVSKQPHLLVFRDSSVALVGAVLVFALAKPLAWLQLYTTYDWRGQRNIFAPAQDRPGLALAAAKVLMARGAHLASIDFELGGPTETPEIQEQVTGGLKARLQDENDASMKCSVRAELRQFDLPLGPTYEQTLKQIHTRTRANLRYYRRNAERDLGCRFVARADLSEAEFLAMNAQSKYGANERLARWRYQSAREAPGGFLCGLHADGGRWLSLAGGRRGRGVAEIDWLMNRDDLPRYSLGTVMRSCLIEHEVEMGTHTLLVEGGTSHPLSGSFRYGNVYNVSMKRGSMRIKLSEIAARRSPGRLIFQHLLEPDRT